MKDGGEEKHYSFENAGIPTTSAGAFPMSVLSPRRRAVKGGHLKTGFNF
jgi:hypothetical protein